MSTRNISWEEEEEGGGGGSRCVGLTTLPPSCADCHEMWQPNTLGLSRSVMGLLYLYPKFEK